MPVLTSEYLKYNPKLPRILYHYCSIDAFLSIIQNKCIWLSDADTTNDTTELNYIFDNFSNVIDETLKKYGNRYSNELKNIIKKMSIEIINNLISKKAPISKFSKNFLCCFSESKDLLSQWRAYGNDGKGVAIGFNSSLLSQIDCDETYGFTKVIYSQKIIHSFLHAALDDRFMWAIDSSINHKTGDFDQIELISQIGMILISIWQEGFVFKHSSFSEEKEWRIYKNTKSTNYSVEDGIDAYGYAGFLDGIFSNNDKYMGRFTRSQLKYRSTNDNIRLYFEIGFESCREKMIKQIILGPKCRINILDLKLLLTQNKYIDNIESKEIEIIKTNSPYI